MKNTTLGYIEYEDYYLMLYRDVNKGDGSLGKWLGVGGKLEKGETADECFIREAYEESGIKLNNISRRGIVDYISDTYSDERMFLYTAKADSMELGACNEGSLKWIKKDEIMSLNMWPGDRLFLPKLINDELLFYMTLKYKGEELVSTINDALLLSDVDENNSDAISLYTKYSEKQLKHYNEPEEGYFIAESPNVIERAMDNGYYPVSFFMERRILFDAAKYSFNNEIPVYSAPLETIRNLTDTNLTLGIMAVMKRKPLPTAEEIINNPNIKSIAVLENVTNPTNIGAIIRSAAALGIDALILTKGCADPLQRRSVRVSLGNIFYLPYAFVKDDNWINELKKADFKIMSMVLNEYSVSLDAPELKLAKKKAICFGNESTGITKSLLDGSDFAVNIPMYNEVDSLNVAAASAVAFWELCRH